MSAKIVGLVRPAEPSLDRALDEFLEEQRARLTPKTFAKYEDVLDLLRSHLNRYAYEGLSKAEAALFDRHFDAEGKEHREFCQLFGPEKIVENLGSFLGYFMVRKVMAGQDLKRAAGTVTKKLSKWLARKGYVSGEASWEAANRGAAAARALPRAERAAQILRDAADQLGIDPADLADEDYIEFDHFTVARVEPGRLWLEVWEGGKRRPCGPIPIPRSATGLLREGWDVSCSLSRVRGVWRIVEVANVYPE
ncbi:MAG: hypothetical protein ACE5I7_13200 [Candidatus Binatia bacterium]